MIRKHILHAAVMAVAIAGLAGFASTASAAMPAGTTWQSVVTGAAKHNGMVTMEDATAYSAREKQFAGFAPWIAENMKILDKNHDGMVDMDEVKAWMTEHHMSNDDMLKIWYREAQQ